MVHSQIVDEIGWLAPDGTYYPCISGVGSNHVETAYDIINDVYGIDAAHIPQEEPVAGGVDRTGGMFKFSTYQFLFNRGFVRVDAEQIEPECGLTFEQLVALTKILKVRLRHGLKPDKIQSILDRNNSEDCENGWLNPFIETTTLIDPFSTRPD